MDFFLNELFQENLSGIPSECLTVRIQIRPELLGLIWVQTVCKGYQQRAKVSTSRERVKFADMLPKDCLPFKKMRGPNEEEYLVIILG